MLSFIKNIFNKSDTKEKDPYENDLFFDFADNSSLKLQILPNTKLQEIYSMNHNLIIEHMLKFHLLESVNSANFKFVIIDHKCMNTFIILNDEDIVFNFLYDVKIKNAITNNIISKSEGREYEFNPNISNSNMFYRLNYSYKDMYPEEYSNNTLINNKSIKRNANYKLYYINVNMLKSQNFYQELKQKDIKLVTSNKIKNTNGTGRIVEKEVIRAGDLNKYSFTTNSFNKRTIILDKEKLVIKKVKESEAHILWFNEMSFISVENIDSKIKSKSNSKFMFQIRMLDSEQFVFSSKSIDDLGAWYDSILKAFKICQNNEKIKSLENSINKISEQIFKNDVKLINCNFSLMGTFSYTESKKLFLDYCKSLDVKESTTHQINKLYINEKNLSFFRKEISFHFMNIKRSQKRRSKNFYSSEFNNLNSLINNEENIQKLYCRSKSLTNNNVSNIIDMLKDYDDENNNNYNRKVSTEINSYNEVESKNTKINNDKEINEEEIKRITFVIDQIQQYKLNTHMINNSESKANIIFKINQFKSALNNFRNVKDNYKIIADIKIEKDKVKIKREYSSKKLLKMDTFTSKNNLQEKSQIPLNNDKISVNSKNSLSNNKNIKMIETLEKEICQIDESIKSINFEFIEKEMKELEIKSLESNDIFRSNTKIVNNSTLKQLKKYFEILKIEVFNKLYEKLLKTFYHKFDLYYSSILKNFGNSNNKNSDIIKLKSSGNEYVNKYKSNNLLYKKSEKLVTHAFDNLVRNIILEESKSISSCVLQIDKLYKIDFL